MNQLMIAGLFAALAATQANAQINAGEQQPETSLPFNMVQVTTLNLPWRIAFLPDGRMLITEKVGALWLVRILGRRHALPLANCKKQITAIRRKSDLAAELSALASLSIAPDHLEILKARRIRADLQPGPCERQARAAIARL